MNTFSPGTSSTGELDQLLTIDATVSGRQSTWFGSAMSPLLGNVHIPDGAAARGAVVLAPPLGKEQVDSYRGLALLAQQLCARGLLVLRFDYAGTGDSAGAQDAESIVGQWQNSIVSAVEFVRSCGVQDVAVVGLRAGSLLAASVVEACGPLAGVVFWDPVTSGRAFLREQRALYSLSVTHDDESDPRVSIIGAVLHASVIEDLAKLDSSKLQPLGCPVLVAARSERRDAKPMRRLIETQAADERIVTGHHKFLEPPGWDVVIPRADVDAIAEWTSARFDSVRIPIAVPIRLRAVLPTPRGKVVETIERIGKTDLFAIRTTGTAAVDGGPVVVMFGTAYEHRVGPVRLWVELARELAANDITALRFDRRGTGESGEVGADDAPKLYSELGDQDALTAVRAAGTDPENVVVAGLCSGAWYASLAAHRMHVNAAILINMREWTTRRVDFTKRATITQSARGFKAKMLDRAHTAGVRVKDWAQPHVPYAMWLGLGRRGWIQVPEITLGVLQDSGVRTSVLLGPDDSGWFVGNRGPESMRRLRRRAKSAEAPVVKSFASGDHTLYGRDIRDTVRTDMLETIGATLNVETHSAAPSAKVNWTLL